ncbi:MAG: glucose-6-phosphate isomerase [Bacteroidota bacterium]|nr:glucose-6-phosphate isomerase [Bacteroidota bacterium]
MISLDLNNIYPFIDNKEFNTFLSGAGENLKLLHSGTGEGNDYLGWLDLPEKTDKKLLDAIDILADEFKNEVELLVVIGIGGSYLGTRAVGDTLNHNFSHLLPNNKPQLIFAGQNLSQDYLNDLLEVLESKTYGIVVISKSGTTTEPALAFRILKQHLEKKIGKEASRKKIIAITDSSKGALRKMADEENYRNFVIPGNVGGRFSVLTPVGLVPLGLAGVDIHELIRGAAEMGEKSGLSIPINENLPAMYAAARNALYNKGKLIELLVNYEPGLHYFSEWWKQLFGESEGKENKGIFPASVDFTSDLHSMGQYIQEGKRNLFETVISVKESRHSLLVPGDDKNLDGLNYISSKPVEEVNKMAELGTLLAHVEGGVPNIRLSVDRLDSFHMGQLVYFFEKACAISGYMLGVNPFDQPGVEAYKRNMFALLGKPGFEAETEKMKKHAGN